MKKMFLGLVFLKSINTLAQDSARQGSLKFSVYAEAYYCYDFNKPAENDRPAFFYSHNRHNEFNVNLAFLKAKYGAYRVRVNVVLAAGTYMNTNYAAEPGMLKNVFEANAGFRISKKKNLWIDAGIFPSHIGFESAASKECWALTRSIQADNSPYFESGVKITYTSSNTRWLVSGLLLNGWQRIKRVTGNSAMSYGTQLQYKPNTDVLLNYSSFVGTDKPDSTRQWRCFHNLYGIFNVSDKVAITAGFDVGSEQKAKGSRRVNTWYSPVLILKHAINGKWAIAVRGEYYDDQNGVIIASVTPNGFQTSAFSFNVDYAPVANALVRLEARTLKSKDDFFVKGNGYVNQNTFITSSIVVNF